MGVVASGVVVAEYITTAESLGCGWRIGFICF